MVPSGEKCPAACATFGDAFDPKQNAFAFLRIFLALLVIVSHSYALGGFGPDPLAAITDGSHNLGEIAVAIFFLLSGFLLTRSGLRSGSIGRFLWHRFLRIFPGYWVCLLLTAFVFSPVFEHLKHGAFSADAALAYVGGNWTMFHLNGFSIAGIMNLFPATIGGVLNDNPHPSNINGSLWSLPYECACYLVLALFAIAGVLRRARFATVILFVGLWALYAFNCLDAEYFHEWFPSRSLKPLLYLTLYFSAGCVCYLYRNSIPASRRLFVTCLGLLAAGFIFRFFRISGTDRDNLRGSVSWHFGCPFGVSMPTEIFLTEPTSTRFQSNRAWCFSICIGKEWWYFWPPAWSLRSYSQC